MKSKIRELGLKHKFNFVFNLNSPLILIKKLVTVGIEPTTFALLARRSTD